MKKFALTLFASVIVVTSNAQFFDNYGIRIGAGLANQHWEYKTQFSNLSGWKKDRIGFSGQLFAEKYLGKSIALRPAIGYLQKGFAQDITLLSGSGEELADAAEKEIMHDLSMDLSVKIIPFKNLIKPYLLFGLRADYLFDSKQVVSYSGEKHRTHSDVMDNFNHLTVGGLVGLGMRYHDIWFLDFEYNPAFSKNYDTNLLSVDDRYFSLMLGVNINQLIKDKAE